jgi:transposase
MIESRQLKALEIVTTSRITQSGDTWIVPSQSSGTKYTVKLSPFSCSCPDFEKRQQACKHLLAVLELIQHNATGQEIPVPAEPVQRPTYKQEWTAYNQAQTNEKARFLELLYELCKLVIDIPRKEGAGRTRLPLGDMIFCAVYKIYSTVSGRRSMSDLKEAQRRGYISKTPHFNSIFNYLELGELTPYLKDLIVESSLPLKTVECDFAVDSSGFSTVQFQRWLNAKYGKAETIDKRQWVKVHLMCGVKTNIVTSVEISGAHAGDSPYFRPLVETTSKNFVMQEVSADKAYSASKNLQLVLVKKAMPYIDFKSNANATDKRQSAVWKRMYHYYQYNQESFMQSYHKRSNVESTFSMIKAKFGERLRSKTEISQTNEVLCKVLCHNLCCVIQSMYELGIDPNF